MTTISITMPYWFCYLASVMMIANAVIGVFDAVYRRRLERKIKAIES